MVAAASNDIPSGMRATALALVTRRLAKLQGPKPTTRSPGAKLPTASAPLPCTTPANSKPRVGPEKPFSMASSDSRPRANITSRKLRPVART
ncbi:hypothetical protein D3C72_1943840 [compost metagenome]